MREVELKATSGYLALVLLLVSFALGIVGMARSIAAERPVLTVLLAFACLVIFVMLFGLFIVHPNETKVIQLFGKYVGSVREPGLKYGNPFYSKAKVSVKVRNFETQKLKVNDSASNPIEIGAVVVWRVVDTAEAVFDVDNYVEYVHVQSESALRALATNYPYDAHEEGTLSLSHNAAEISTKLQDGVQERLARAGVEVMEARISHLAYAPEIASAMLQRQQASAVIAARQKIVEGAVGMVEMALADLSRKEIVHLDEERKAQMVSNLLVVLCSDRNAQPIVNAGSIY
jgi:regulator of protease activity HflC (stomatin/prohibitin superfamily)